MKVTIEIPDALLSDIRNLAADKRTTVDVLVERGLRRILSDVREVRTFKLRRASFKGRGLQPEVEESWEIIGNKAYEGRGT